MPFLVPATLKSMFPRASSIPLGGWGEMREGTGQEGRERDWNVQKWNSILQTSHTHTNQSTIKRNPSPLLRVESVIGRNGMNQRFAFIAANEWTMCSRNASNLFPWGRHACMCGINKPSCLGVQYKLTPPATRLSVNIVLSESLVRSCNMVWASTLAHLSPNHTTYHQG